MSCVPPSGKFLGASRNALSVYVPELSLEDAHSVPCLLPRVQKHRRHFLNVKSSQHLTVQWLEFNLAG